jgi:hypothetical protein
VSRLGITLKYSSKNFKNPESRIPVLKFFKTEKPVLKKDTGFEKRYRF